MATLMDVIMNEYQKAKVVPSAPGTLTRQLATEVPMPNGSLPPGSLTRQLATEVPLPTVPQIPQAPIAPRPSPFDETNIAAPYNPMAMVGNAQRFPSMADMTAANPLAVPGANTPVVAGLDTANRPAPIAGSASVPNRPQGFFEQLFKGPQYQSNNLPVGMTLPSTDANPPKYINWGDPNSAADFFRADALLRQQNPSFFGLLGGNNG